MLNHIFFFIQFPFIISFVLKGGKGLWFLPSNQIHRNTENNGRRKCLHIWVWRWIGQGDVIDVWCARRLMWTEAGGEKEMFLYRYPSLSAHHFSASWPWHHGGPGGKAEETIGSLCGSRACGVSMSTHAVSLSSGLASHIRKWQKCWLGTQYTLDVAHMLPLITQRCYLCFL